MKHLNIILIILSLAALLLGPSIPAQASPSAFADEWQTYTDLEVGFSIQTPAAWTNEALPDQNDGAIHGRSFTGPEGGVEVYWGTGFGGACPEGTEPVQLARVEAQACHTTAPDGTEAWNQIGYQVEGGNDFSARAYTNDAEPASRDVVLEVLSTLAFMPPAAGRVPLVDALDMLEPQDVWQNFYDLTQIPRPSHHEEQVRDFLVQFGEGLGLETIVDDAGNVIIRKPASPGMEDRQGVVLQAHMDMVPQKTAESTHDFLTDPIEAYVDGEWAAADGTTLGADDGSGVAIAMAILQSETLSLGPIEALFTVNEEDGMDGALGLEPGVLQGSILINLDSETEGEFTIGSAGGEYANVEANYDETQVPDDVAAYTVTVSGLQGGHSGMDINLGRGHAVKLLVRFLDTAADEYGARVAWLTGGTAANAIPRDASALVVLPTDQVDAFLQGVQEFEATVKAELAATEPDLAVQAEPADLPAKVMDDEAQATLIAALYGAPQGVMRMSDAVPGLVETSTNIGIVNAAEGELAVTGLSRSSVDSELDDIGRMLASVWRLAGVDVALSGQYSGWNPNPDSSILLLMADVYRDMYGQDPKVTAVHAGLECGTIVSKYPGMDAISIGPTLQNVHSPSERIEIASVEKLYDFLIETLKRIPGSDEATIEPLPAESCDSLAQAMADALGVAEATQSEAPLDDLVTGASGTGCQATVTGAGEQFASPDAVAQTLGGMLEAQGWTLDPMLAAGGPMGIGMAYRNDNQICWVVAQWQPDPSANCPKDQPISACELTPEQQVYTVTLNCGVETTQGEDAGMTGIANPASVNCKEQGGTLVIEERGDGGQFGVCYFEDNLQCEEWALLRGDCPVGGVKVTGYVTPAARYCAITGGEYAVTAAGDEETEQGTCTFKSGTICDAWGYYNGQCAP